MEKKTISWKLIVAAVVLIAVIAGVGIYYTLPPPAEEEKPPLKVAYMTLSTIADGGWNMLHYEGLVRAKERWGIEFSLAENVPFPDVKAREREYCALGYDLILLASTFPWGDPALELAEEYPNVKFHISTGYQFNNANVASTWTMEGQACYLAGAVAGLMTKTNVIGCIGGEEYPNTRVQANAWILGAKAVNPNVKIIFTWAGTWGDPAKGKEIAISTIAAGADVVQHFCSGTGMGVIEGCREKGVYVIGDTVDQNYLAPKYMLTSRITRHDLVVLRVIEQVINGTFKGDLYRPKLGEGYHGLAPYHGLVPDNIANQIKDLEQAIINGTLVIPENMEPVVV